MALTTVLAAAAGLLFSALTQTAGAANEPRMQFDKRMKAETVCFTVTNPSGGQSTLYGQSGTQMDRSPH